MISLDAINCGFTFLTTLKSLSFGGIGIHSSVVDASAPMSYALASVVIGDFPLVLNEHSTFFCLAPVI